MDHKRLLLAALLSLIVLFGWQALFPPAKTEAPAPGQTETQEVGGRTEAVATEATVDETAPADEPGDAAPASLMDESVVDESTVDGARASEPGFEVRVAQRQQVVVLGNGHRRVEFTNRGAVMQHYVLLDRVEAGGGELDLVRRREGGLEMFALVDSAGEPLPVNRSLFEVEKGDDWVHFVWSDGTVQVEKYWQLLGDGRVRAAITVQGVEDWAWHMGPGVRNPPPDEAASRLMRRNAVYRVAGEVETVAVAKAEEPFTVPTATSWVGLEDNYFLAVVIPEEDSDAIRFVPFRSTAEPGGIGTWVAPGPVFAGLDGAPTEWGIWVSPAAASWNGELYLGAKEMTELASIAPGLDDTVHTGFLRILARPLHVALLWIHDHIVANYGWAIVLLTLAVRIVLFPLTHKSAVSMRKMQALNPKIQAIRSKYRPKLKDKQGRPNVEMQRKMNEEVMALYKAEGVNPAGGCLPMLLQLPVFIAFYTMLPVAVELRNASWFGWIQDLSVPDPYYVLPIVMGASQLLFQRLMPSAGDRMQQRIMMLMPIFFTFLFLKFAAGLVLYWLTSNVLGIGQQLITNRLLGPPQAADAARAAK